MLDNAYAENFPEKAELENDSAEIFKNLMPDVFAKLSDIHREVLTLKYNDNLEISIISLELNIPVGTVKSRLHNALIEIRNILKSMNFQP